MAGRARQLGLRQRYSGVLWQHRLTSAAMPLVDTADRLVRSRRGLHSLPPYSARIRSSGMVGEFGGRKFSATGQRLKRNLIKHAGLQPEHRLLDVGCGVGRTALALAGYLSPGAYVGFDIDEASIAACRRSPHLQDFSFFHADVDNDLYRPVAGAKASHYRFPLDDSSFDVVVAASVFTHMLEDDCANYAREIERVLKPGGTAAISTFLLTEPVKGQPHSFHHRVGSAYVQYPDKPTKRVAYELSAFRRWFGAEPQPLLGRWRGDGAHQISEWQDWVMLQPLA